MNFARKRLTYANVMSSIAVFLVLGGAAFAAVQLPKNSVGTKQLKKNAVNGSKVKDNSLTGSDVNESTLGTVPSATNANHAAVADNATHSSSADNATHATNSDQLGGAAASTYAKAQLPTSTTAGLINGWKQEPGRATATYYKDPFGIVHLEGIVEGGPDFSEIFKLPAGYRPGADANFLIYGSASTAAGLFIGTEGTVFFLEGDNTFVSLYGVTFRAEK